MNDFTEPGTTSSPTESEGVFFIIVDVTSASGDRTPIFTLDAHKKPRQYKSREEARRAASEHPMCRYNPYWILEMNTGEVTG